MAAATTTIRVRMLAPTLFASLVRTGPEAEPLAPFPPAALFWVDAPLLAPAAPAEPLLEAPALLIEPMSVPAEAEPLIDAPTLLVDWTWALAD